MQAMVPYADHGFRTRRGAMTMTNVLLIAHLTLVVLRAGHDGLQPALVASGAWLIVLWLATSRTLRRLARLEADQPQATAAMKLAFQQAVLVPIVGTVPLLFAFLSGS